jgi:hypothetical protein
VTYVVHHAGVGFLVLDADAVRISTDIADARRFGNRASAQAVADEQNAREHHSRWRALSWETASALTRGGAA